MSNRVTVKVREGVHKDTAKVCKEVLFPKVNLTDYIEQALIEKNERTIKELEKKKAEQTA